MLASYIAAGVILSTATWSLCQTINKVPNLTNGLDENGANVCTFDDQVTKQVPTFYWQTTLTKVSKMSCCNRLCWSKCKKIVTVTRKYKVTRLETRLFDRKVFSCCFGWKKENANSTGCSKAKCWKQCLNGGECVAPDVCKCALGFEGRYCQLDVDECFDTTKNNCEQQCVNTKPGFKCACKQGFKLNGDQKSCSDVNECVGTISPCGCEKEGVDGVCKATCENKNGGFACKCSSGYRLNSVNKCEDINECVMKPGLCDQLCVNVPGSYRCACATGFTYDGNKCVDDDECADKNGGCSDFCHNLKGGYSCTCPNRFYLDTDRKSCKVITPSMKHVTFCETEHPRLQCEKLDQKIAVIDVVYGRLTDQICQMGNYTADTRCQAIDASLSIERSCNGTSMCAFQFDKSLFGDPCPGVSKYLQIVYDCLN